MSDSNPPVEPPQPESTPATQRGFKAWLYKRLPLQEFIDDQLTGYYPPKNLNFWYYFGVMLLAALALQLITGIFLAMFYKASVTTAFASVEYIMRDVQWGWLIRYLHSTGASFFFIVVYLHMFHALLYGSYKAPRELLWLLGMASYVALMAEAFMGYVLPWGNLSYWGAQVIVNLFGTIPFVGPGLAEWIRGDYSVGDATLSRFFSLHVVAVPLALLLIVILHLIALRRTGSNNPDGIEVKEHLDSHGKPLDGIAFHPYDTVKDVVAVAVFLLALAAVVFFAPTFGGLFLESPNFEPANPISTPPDITPVWYLTPYYAILRAVPDQRLGALLMFLALASFLFLPWLDVSPVKSMRYRGLVSRAALGTFVVSFLALMYLGRQPSSGLTVTLARIFSVLYFAYFWLMPIYQKFDKVKPVPQRLTFPERKYQ